MRIRSLMISALVLIVMGCSTGTLVEKVRYDSMHFARQGGGQIDFSVYPTDNADRLKVTISRYQFRDTTVQLILNNSADCAGAFAALHKALNRQARIEGDFKQSTLLTGTWVHIYMVSHSKETEVTDVRLRNALLQFERIVRRSM